MKYILSNVGSIVSISLLSATLSLGCKDPAKSVPAAKVEQGEDDSAKEPANPEATKEPLQGESKAIALNADNTTVGFTGSKVTGSHAGGFKELTGELMMGSDLSATKAKITIDMSSTFSDDEKLTGHLKSPDFFDVAKFPTAIFSVNSIAAEKSETATHVLTGELTLHGVTKPVSFPASVSKDDTSLKADAEFSINRKDFGIEYPGMKDDLIRDDVVIRLNVDLDLAKS